MKIQEELAESRKALEASEARLKAQSEKDDKTIRDLQDTLQSHLEEITELDKHILGTFGTLGKLCTFTAFLTCSVFLLLSKSLSFDFCSRE